VTGPTKNAIYAGTSGWAYPSWKPDFYPTSVPAKKLLAYYATRLSTVEVNYTFRSLPSASTMETWLAETGDDFRFSFKAPQRITHILRLKNCSEALERFAHSIAPVASAGRLGVILFQLPPNLKMDMERLGSFLKEAEKLGNGGKHLGPLGSRLVMETLHAAIQFSSDSIIDDSQRVNWTPDPLLKDPASGRYTFPDLIVFTATH